MIISLYSREWVHVSLGDDVMNHENLKLHPKKCNSVIDANYNPFM